MNENFKKRALSHCILKRNKLKQFDKSLELFVTRKLNFWRDDREREEREFSCYLISENDYFYCVLKDFCLMLYTMRKPRSSHFHISWAESNSKSFPIISIYTLLLPCIALSIPPYNIIWLNIKFNSINNLNGNYMRILVNFSCKSMRDRTDVIVHRFISVCVYLKLFQLFSNLCSSYWFPFNVHVFHAGVFSLSISLPYSIFSLLLICHVVFIRMANLAHTSLFN